jgi:transposase-like protein
MPRAKPDMRPVAIALESGFTSAFIDTNKNRAVRIKQTAIDMYLAGHNVTHISQILLHSTMTIGNWIKASGLKGKQNEQRTN